MEQPVLLLLGIIALWVQDLPLLRLLQFFLAWSCRLSKALWIVAHLSLLPPSSPHLVSTANSGKTDSITLSSWHKNTEQCWTPRSFVHDQLNWFSFDLQTTSPEMEESLWEGVPWLCETTGGCLVLPIHWCLLGDGIDGFVLCSGSLKLVLEDWRRCSDLAFEVTGWHMCKSVELSVLYVRVNRLLAVKSDFSLFL